MKLIEACGHAIQHHQLIRRVAFFWMLGLTTWVTWWAVDFVTYTTKTGAEVGLMVGAITGPLALLQGHVFKLYNEARNGGSNGG